MTDGAHGSGAEPWQAGRSPAWVRHSVFYGIDVARFHGSGRAGSAQHGDLPGLAQKLDYLYDLGATCLWLLPFYPSERRDNGYAVTDYLGVDPRFGDLNDFRELTAQAHARGIRVMVDLVIHHTSSKHPWFQAAEADSSSRYRDYYVWSDDKPDDDESQSVFPEEEHGIWAFSERAEAYYRHKFYDFQPDLNLNNDAVWESVTGIVDFWITMGVDGFRVDAATLMFTNPWPGEPTFEGRFDGLRAYLRGRAPHVALLGEADVAPGELRRYFDAGRFDLLYDFLANNALYLSLVRESATPLAATLERLREVTGGACLLNFVRNVDELDLEQLTDAERDEVFRTLAPELDMRIYGRGIRRGWAPMMRNREQLEMSMSLLFALPGVPLVMYGQEAVRTDPPVFVR
jgi:maltose alpha-D-glucosyltransferase/alpha-amylase